MRKESDTLERFVRRIHRRWVMLRALEAAGAGAAVGSAAALALVPVLLWRNQPAVGVAVMLMAVTGAAGLLFALLRRPSFLSAAIEADRQLDLHDLLATALGARGETDPWSNAVVTQAQRRCQTLSPDAIVLNRLGVRAWSGIGLTAAMVMTLSLLSTHPESLSASSHRASFQDEDAERSAPHAPTAHSGDDQPTGPADRLGSGSQPRRRGPEGNDSALAGISSGDNGSGSTDDTGSGLGDAETDDPAILVSPGDPSRPNGSPRPEATPSSPAGDLNGLTAAGGGAAQLAEGGRTPSEGLASEHGGRVAVAPWTSGAWGQARAEAEQALNSGRVPDGYRELVRGYFDQR